MRTLLVLLTLTMCCLIVPARAETPERYAFAGQSLKIGSFANLNRNCTSAAPPRVVVNEQPRHGRLHVEQGPFELTWVGDGGNKSCIGSVLTGAIIRYIPDATYTGEDHISYTVHFARGAKPVSLNFAVRPALIEKGTNPIPPVGSSAPLLSVDPQAM